MNKTDNRIYKIALTGLFAAMSYVVFAFLQIKITLPGGDATSIHLGNAVCVLGALLLGGFYGGLGGAIGMALGDLFDPVYVVYTPTTLVLKLGIGLITGFLAHNVGKINESTDKKHILIWTIVAASGGLLFNVILAPPVGYFYKLLILGRPSAELALVWNIASTTFNAVTSAVVSVAVYLPLRNALLKSGLYVKIC